MSPWSSFGGSLQCMVTFGNAVINGRNGGQGLDGVGHGDFVGKKP